MEKTKQKEISTHRVPAFLLSDYAESMIKEKREPNTKADI